ncbi:MAG: hypothetical protein ACFB4I_22315 [Cyanophyceae cyanobacterium]
MAGKFIVYACPVGELADQLEQYFQESRRLCGANTAHKYMPHCTLTSFFDDETSLIPLYLEALDKAYAYWYPHRPTPVIRIADMQFQPDWHGFELESEWLKQLVSSFINEAQSPARQDPLHRKEWLHLSFAYDFSPQSYRTLVRVAQELIDPHAAVRWELRFYERYPDWTWMCHQSWLLS